ncbi:hypothetical protein ABZ639_17030 [Saccharomonospora sp. NPDC006951]
MTRFLIGDPDAAARTAKNAHAASGLPTRTTNRSLGRNPMVDANAPADSGDEVVYTPAELNALITRAVAERLRDRAEAHRRRAAVWAQATGDDTDPYVVFHSDEAAVLELMAARSLHRAYLGEGRDV